MNRYHTSVLLHEALSFLNPESGGKYIDATLGGGGHALEVVKSGGRLLGIDMDQEAIDYVKQILGENNEKYNFEVCKGNFRDLGEIARKNNFDKVNGILFDLGVSGHQFDTPLRGFSCQKEGPLDMRMDVDLAVRAKDLVNVLSRDQLYKLFTELGEERFAYVIANAIVKARRIKTFENTSELVDLIKRVTPGGIDISARIFQALRCAVNDELNNLRLALPQAFDLLNKNGRIVVISFQSLEDRIVKNQFIKWSGENKGIILTRKPVTPGEEEIENNYRSRSAKLRVFQKI